MIRILQRLFKVRAIAAGRILRRAGTKTPLLPGGGLDKLQGGFKEEIYFKSHDEELIDKIREQETKVPSEDRAENWKKFTKALVESANHNALREGSCMNKHKNCVEEAYFLAEKQDSLSLLKKQLTNEHALSKIVEEQTPNSNSDDDALPAGVEEPTPKPDHDKPEKSVE